MKTIHLFTLLLFCCITCVTNAQESTYREFRARVSIPPYGLEKIKALLKDAPEKETDPNEIPDGVLKALPDKVYNELSVREKFTYTMVHPEVYSQNCAIFVPQPDEENKIFGYLISWTNEETWSDRQLKFLEQNKDSIISIIKESVTRSKRMGVNYKDAIVEMNAWEMIPFLISYYKDNKKDKDVLTTLMLLMKKGNYPDFIKSKSYKNLYGIEDNYESSMNFNKANEDLVIQRAQSYFALKMGNGRKN